MGLIFVDSREKNQIKDFLSDEGIDIKIESMPVGDYMVGNICVEYKSIQDYIQSLHSGHLHKQLYQMSYNFELSYLMVGGLYGYEIGKTGSKKASFISSICGSSFKRANDGKMGQVVTVQFEQEYDCALFLKFLLKKVEEGDNVRLPTMERHNFSKTDWQLRMVSSLPNVGEKLGKLMFAEFGTLQSIANASKEELMNVKGISTKKANVIYEVFHTEFNLNRKYYARGIGKTC